jgi:hypothetical protein
MHVFLVVARVSGCIKFPASAKWFSTSTRFLHNLKVTRGPGRAAKKLLIRHGFTEAAAGAPAKPKSDDLIVPAGFSGTIRTFIDFVFKND